MKYRVIIILFAALSTGCESSDDEIRAQLRKETNQVSSKRISELRPQYDSLCALRHEIELPRLIDSIYRVRKQDVKDLSEY